MNIHKIDQIQWKKLIDSLKKNTLIEKRISKINQLVKGYLNFSEINLEFDIPNELTLEKYQKMYIKTFLIYHYLYQSKLHSMNHINNTILLEDSNSIEYIVQEELVKIRIKLLEGVLVSIKNSKHFNHFWIFALHNFSKNEKFKQIRGDLQELSKYLVQDIKEGKMFDELNEDPMNKSQEEIENTINKLKKYPNKNKLNL